jgi:FMN-dependent NADH-azoreductase
MTGQELDHHQKSSWNTIEANIERFLDTDVYLVTTPMWNFGIPYALKYYIDAIVQPGYLFRYDEFGAPEGLVKGKKMVVVTSRGGDYSSNSPLFTFDFVEPYLRTIFNFVGITDIRFINAQPMDISLAARRAAFIKAIDEAQAIAADENWFSHRSDELIEFPEGIKPRPIRSPQGEPG